MSEDTPRWAETAGRATYPWFHHSGNYVEFSILVGVRISGILGTRVPTPGLHRAPVPVTTFEILTTFPPLLAFEGNGPLNSVGGNDFRNSYHVQLNSRPRKKPMF